MSHPAWVCGLKPAQILNANITTSHTLRGCVDWNRLLTKNGCDCIVTPCVGVWIETYLPADVRLSPMSHPAWVCGLKLLQYWLLYIHEKSHPAWVCGLKLFAVHRTPQRIGHTLRGCVDWNTRIDAFWAFLWVTPCVGVWIETAFIILARAWAIVTPCVGVWIETYELRNALDYGTSHPAWVCGLKQLKKKIPVVMFVTPCVGVWIETMLFLCVWFLVLCHTLRGCVDWN